jgi:saccharopine dehydrogenase-like NADP-dependent oxidoreductase
MHFLGIYIEFFVYYFIRNFAEHFIELMEIKIMAKIIVLGCGMVGSAMAIDLAKRHQVSIADINENALAKVSNFGIKTILSDLSITDNIKDIVKDFDLVIGAVPGFMGYKTCEAVIKAKKNIVDISFFPEDLFGLDAIAKQNNVTCIVDCGVAPGMGNILLGHHNSMMDVEKFECFVGGLPVKREKPFEYKAPFSPIDVLEEYTRPARYVENSFIITKPALSDAEYIEFDEVGTLEAFNTDGLRSLMFTMKIPNMKEKTLRYPGHIEYIKVLKDAGFFNTDKIEIAGTRISPINFTSKILFDKWKLGAEEEEFTIMRVNIEGKETGLKKRYTYNLYDRYNPETKTSSMARTTGYTATAAANMFLDGLFSRKGVIPPEFIGEDKNCFKYIMNYLSERGIYYRG